MNVKEIDQIEFEKLSLKYELSFLQSRTWAAVKSGSWHPLFLRRDGFPILLLRRDIPLKNKSFAYIPRLFNNEDFDSKTLGEIVEYIKNRGDIVHIDIDFEITDKSKLEQIRKFGFKSSGEQLQPQFTNIINLVHGKEVLYQNLKTSTRNKINKPAKSGAIAEVFIEGTEPFERSYKIINSVTKLTDYVAHDKSYFKRIWDLFGEKQQVKIIIASIDGVDFGTYFSILNGVTQWELYGGMNEVGRNLRGAGYFLKWESIKEAIDSNIKFYDQWGIAPKLEDGSFDKNHRFYNIGNFKKEFNGTYTEYLAQQTLVFDNSGYQLFSLGKKTQQGILKVRKKLSI